MIDDLLPGYRFVVTLDPTDAYIPAAQALLVPVMIAAGFQEITGIGGELEVMPYPEGGANDFVHQLPVRHSWNRITMRRGVVRDLGLWAWYQAGLTQSLGARRDGAITMLTASGTPAVIWIFRSALAAKWTGPDLNAEEGAVAVESIEIAHQGITQLPLTPPGTA